MASHNEKLAWYSDLICGKDMVEVTFFGRGPVRVIPEAVEAVKAVEQALIDTGYDQSGGPIGSYACRKIGGSEKWSLHAVPIALDIEYDVNPHVREPIARGFGTDPRFRLREIDFDAIEAIKNHDGDSIWKCLVWSLGDSMHIELDVPRDKLQVAGGGDMWANWVEGLVTGWAEDPVKTEAEFQRLKDEGLLSGSIQYWVDLLAVPGDAAWLGFVSRTWLSSWHSSV